MKNNLKNAKKILVNIWKNMNVWNTAIENIAKC